MRVEGLMALCEENACWPLDRSPVVDVKQRHAQYIDTDEEGVQAARVGATRDERSNNLMGMGFILLFCIGAVFTLMIVAFLAPTILEHIKDVKIIPGEEPAAFWGWLGMAA